MIKSHLISTISQICSSLCFSYALFHIDQEYQRDRLSLLKKPVKEVYHFVFCFSL